MTAITRAILADAAARRTGINKDDIANISEAMFALMTQALMDGETVKLTGFGSLQVRDRAERMGRNPRTGTYHRITPRQTIVFTPGMHLREAMENFVPQPAHLPQPKNDRSSSAE